MAAADISKIVSIIFTGEDNVSSVVKNIQWGVKETEATFSRIGDPFASFGEGVLKADTALMALVTGGMALAVKKAGEFGGSFGEISTLIDATGLPLENFKNQILDYSTQSVKSIEDINKAIYAAISAGVDYSESVEFVTAAEKLAVAGRADLEVTTRTLAGTLNAYGASTQEAEHYSDLMFTTARLGQTTFSELSTQLSKVTGLAANAGVPFETLSAAIAALTVSGLPTEAALTGIKAALTNIIKPSAEAEKMAEALGIQFNATSLKTKGLEGILWDAWRATGGNTEKMAELFGSVEALNAVLILASDKTGKFKGALDAMQSASGATATAYAKMANELENANTRLENNVNATLITLGERLMPAYKEAVSGLSDMFAGLKIGLDDGTFNPVFAALDKLGDKIFDVLKQMMADAPDAFKSIDWTKLVNAIENVSEAFDDLLSNTNGDEFANMVQRMVDSISSLIDVTMGMIEAMTPFGRAVLKVIDDFNGLDDSTKELLGVISGVSMAFKLFGPVVGTILLMVGSDSEEMSKIVTLSFLSIQNGINALKVAVLSLAMVFASASYEVAKLLDHLPGYDAAEGIERTAERVAVLNDLLSEAQTQLAVSSQEVQDAWNGTGEKVTDVTKKYDDAVKGLENSIGSAKGAINDVGKAVDGLPTEKKVSVGVDIDSAKKNLEAAKSTITKESEIIKAALEWKAKLDIAEIEAQTKRLESMFESINTSIESTGSVIDAALGALTGAKGLDKGTIEDVIRDEEARREEAFKQQKDLVTLQTELLREKIDQMRSGDNVITVQADGLKPHLEAILWEVLEAIQLRAAEEQAEFLLGIQ